ncbi:conserved hypothetical protein [Aspergillus terreus NIH2624]|uniref:O-methyltransferase C-terminal domain-containing protein n=1 Tax=Aspergillus terreus (strain NIH 2624 / FGSC A1156) TaxID=341663 RepID=Q0CZ84_ASPTN|nr:uncharacterized protein ATEG_01000 [Aspergillus terreus NIH2624]EAU37757.1 conserved hypothetical protein [Aspergillus terreus NIH2624]
MGERFDRAMHAVNINTIDAIPWLYPFDTLAAAGNILVDVGGGLGHVSKQILAAYPDSGLQCIVQDVVALCESVDRVNNLKLQLHSFFDPQPVRGAAAYFFRHIFHDWADDACVTILRRTVDAMDVEQSRILICDQIMDELNPSVASMLYDIDMMSLFGGKERSLGQWEDLLMQADPRLYIRRVWKNAATLTVIIEVRLKNSK